MKTYSVAMQTKESVWITNWDEWPSREDIDWVEVEKFCRERGYIAYGYYFGHHSRNLTAARSRVLMWSAESETRVKDHLR